MALTPAMNAVEPSHPLFEAVFTRMTDEMSITRIGLLERQLPALVKWRWIGHSRCVAAEKCAGKHVGFLF